MKKLILLPFLIVAFASYAQTKLTIQSSNEQCARVSDDIRNVAEGDDGFWAARLVTGGPPLTVRSFLQFDLSSIPQGSFVNWARLTLYTESASGPGNFLLRRVTSPWNEQTVTWNTQPSEALRATIRLPISSAIGILKNLNVTNLLQNMVDSPATSFGFVIRIDSDESGNENKSAFFKSPSFGEPHYNPKLVLEYTTPGMQPAVTSMALNNKLSTEMTIYPNPCHKAFNCSIRSSFGNITLRVIDMLGRTVSIQPVNSSDSQLRIEFPENTAGTYFVVLQDSKNAMLVSQELQVN